MTRGRKPLPTVVKALNGNPGKRPPNTSEPKPKGTLKAAPASLTPDQVIIWKNTLKIAPAELLTPVDSSVVERFKASSAVQPARCACATSSHRARPAAT